MRGRSRKGELTIGGGLEEFAPARPATSWSLKGAGCVRGRCTGRLHGRKRGFESADAQRWREPIRVAAESFGKAGTRRERRGCRMKRSAALESQTAGDHHQRRHVSSGRALCGRESAVRRHRGVVTGSWDRMSCEPEPSSRRVESQLALREPRRARRRWRRTRGKTTAGRLRKLKKENPAVSDAGLLDEALQ